MSRIHEALKRAEQERSANQTGQRVEDRADLIAANNVIETEPPASNGSSPATLRSAILPVPETEVLPKALKFEEIWANCSRPQWHPNRDFLVFSNSDPFRSGTEQFRTLRSRLYRIRENRPLQTILISSSIPAEGKTVVAVNLAHALARQAGCRVLLIDADLRSPRIHSLLGAPASPGLADYLQNGREAVDVIQRGNEGGFCFIPTGNHVTHPSELISSGHMKQFLERSKSAFDWIIIDSPPALPVADASVLGSLCDGVLLVVRANSTPSETAQKACRELQETHILGVVLNSVDCAAEYGTYYSNSSIHPPSEAR